jgi:hypothetical protein
MPLICKLASPELQKRKQTLLAELKGLIIVKIELENGFQYEFIGSDANIDLLSSFIKTERLCCDFFRYDLKIGEENMPLTLTLTGPQGAKEFIRTELEL